MDKSRSYNRNAFVKLHEMSSKAKEMLAKQKSGVLAEKELARESRNLCTTKSRMLGKKCKY